MHKCGYVPISEFDILAAGMAIMEGWGAENHPTVAAPTVVIGGSRGGHRK